MSQGLMESVEVEVDTRSGGILDASLPVPQGWRQGLSIPFYGCGEPVLMNRCVTADDTAPLNKPSVAEFLPFGITQSAACSSLSRLDQKKHATGRLDSTTEWAVARQLATDDVGLGTPSFADGTSLGTEIRDHALNRQNKVAAFAESYEGILARGCNALGLDIPVEICDNVACPS